MFNRCYFIKDWMHVAQILHVLPYHQNVSHFDYFWDERHYNVPRACLLNRSPIPAMDLKRNRSGL